MELFLYAGLLRAPSGMLGMLFGALMLVWVLSEVFVGRLGLRLGSLESDRGSALAVVVSGLMGLNVAFATSWLGILPVAPAWIQWLGLALMVAGLALRIVSIIWLGPMFTRFVQIVPGHRLVRSGPYRFTRHPSYSGLLLFFLGVGLALGDWASVAALVLLPPVGIIYRIKVEEEALEEAFGEEYRAYRREVRGLVPFLF